MATATITWTNANHTGLSALKEEMLAALDGGGGVELDLSNAKHFDSRLSQLLVASFIEADLLNATLHIVEPPSQAVTRALFDGGFIKSELIDGPELTTMMQALISEWTSR